MGNVYEAVASGRMSVQKAAEEHGTLNDKVPGKLALKARSGTIRARLAGFLVSCASMGSAKSCRDILAIAQQIASVQNPNVEITKASTAGIPR